MGGGSGSLTYGFEKCGTSVHTDKAADGYTVYTSYINQRLTVGSVVASILDQTKIECRFSNVDLDTKNSLSANDEETGTAQISDLKTALSLKLEAGTRDSNDKFTAVSGELEVRLTGKEGWKYAISNCKATASSSEVPLYASYCPNSASKVVSLSKIDEVSFKLNLFRIGSETTLTFTCTVGVYTETSLPEASKICKGQYTGRRRRSIDADGATEEVAVTVTLADTPGSSAANTCANIILPTFIMYNLI